MDRKKVILRVFDIVVLTLFLLGSTVYFSNKMDSLIDEKYEIVKDNKYPIGHHIRYGVYNHRFIEHRLSEYNEQWYETGKTYHPREEDKTFVRLS